MQARFLWHLCSWCGPTAGFLGFYPENSFNDLREDGRLSWLLACGEWFRPVCDSNPWCTDVERNPITNKNESHDHHVQKEIKGIPAKLASFPEARSLGRPAIFCLFVCSLSCNLLLISFIFILIC